MHTSQCVVRQLVHLRLADIALGGSQDAVLMGQIVHAARTHKLVCLVCL